VGLRRWCQEASYLAEPTVVVIATHGTPKGVPVASGAVIGAKAIAESLGQAGNVQLLHFSACQVMKGPMAKEIHAALPAGTSFPVSGYTTTVDWAASAVIEFMYLDLILARHKSPEVAASQIVKLMPFAGDTPSPGTGVRPAGFRFLQP
jgi:hypothetical protein